jgi:hypothetical protein
MQLVLKKFDISSIPDNSICVMISRRNGGKTTCLKDIMYYHKDIPVGTVINPTEAANRSYSDLVPSLFIHEEYSPKLINDLVARQISMTRRVNKEKEKNGRSVTDPRAFLILDDCMYDNIWKKDKNMRYIFQNGRHQQLLCIITLQYVMGIPPELRCNVDYAFIFRDNNISNRRRLYENYCSIIPTFDMFNSIMDYVTTDGYGCLVVNNLSRSSKLEDCIFWYEAEQHSSFNIGSKEFWAIHNELAAEEENEGEELYDPSIYANKKNRGGPLLNIKKSYR